jgi:hypothetical protein
VQQQNLQCIIITVTSTRYISVSHLCIIRTKCVGPQFDIPVLRSPSDEWQKAIENHHSTLKDCSNSTSCNSIEFRNFGSCDEVGRGGRGREVRTYLQEEARWYCGGRQTARTYFWAQGVLFLYFQCSFHKCLLVAHSVCRAFNSSEYRKDPGNCCGDGSYSLYPS